MNLLFGVDIGGTDIKLGMVGPAGEVVESGKIPTEPGEGATAAARRVREWLDVRPERADTVSAAGVDCAGLVDGTRGFLHVSPNLPGWENVHLARVFSEALGMPVVIDNDVNCAAYGEYLFGAGRNTKSFFCITLGTGVGGGMIIDGAVYRGPSGFAGEIGHTIIRIDGPECTCGNRGCLEAFVNARAIVDRARALLDEGSPSALRNLDPLTAKGIARAAVAGDRFALRTLAETGYFLGVGLANLTHLLDPETIAIGGGIAGAGELILGPARESLREHLMDDVFADVRVVPAELGNNASFIGAALLARDAR